MNNMQLDAETIALVRPTVYAVEVELVQDQLGTVPKNRDVYAKFVAGKAALTDAQLAEELATVEHVEESGWTGFHRDEETGAPFLQSYMIGGFFKSAGYTMRTVPGSASAKLTAYKSRIASSVRIWEGRLWALLPGSDAVDAQMGVLERPLRADTAQGPRVALARSDTLPPGTRFQFTLLIVGSTISEQVLREWLAYGAFQGLGQWRGAGYGQFKVKRFEKLDDWTPPTT